MTATAKQIDWNKPVQARWYTSTVWCPARVICTDRNNSHSVVCLITEHNGSECIAQVMPCGGGCNFTFRNTPAPPVTFEFTRYVNVRRRDDGTFHDGGQVYADADTAARGLSNKFVTVPVTIRGEWKDGESNG